MIIVYICVLAEILQNNYNRQIQMSKNIKRNVQKKQHA